MAAILMAVLGEEEIAEDGFFGSSVGIEEGCLGEVSAVTAGSSTVGSDHLLGRSGAPSAVLVHSRPVRKERNSGERERER